MSLIWFCCDLHNLVCVVCLCLVLRLLLLLCGHYDGSDFTGCVFSIYTTLSVFDTNVSSPLRSTICVNCCRPTPQSRKRPAPSLLSPSSFGGECFSLLGHMTRTGFTPVNSALSSSETESLSPFIRRKQAGDRWKTKKAARDGN